MSPALLTHSSNKYTDDFRSEAQLTWIALLLASFALGAVLIWSLSNQQLLIPSVVTPGVDAPGVDAPGVDAPDAPIAQLSQLPKRLEVAGAEPATSSNIVDAKTNGQATAVEATEEPVSSSLATTANSTVAETQSEITSVIDTLAKVADVNDATSNDATVNDATVNDAKIEVGPLEAVQAELKQMEFGQVELVETGLAQAEIKPATVAVVEDPAIDESGKRIEPQETPISEPDSKLVEIEAPAKLEQDNGLLAELTVQGQLAVKLPATPPVTPPETAFEKLRREELALLATYSEKLQVVPKLDALDSTETPQLFQIFDVLFLYSETSVSVTVQSNDTDSTLRNLTLAQQRGELIVDYLVLSGLDRSRFNIIAESSAQLLPGSHRIAIQATLD